MKTIAILTHKKINLKKLPTNHYMIFYVDYNISMDKLKKISNFLIANNCTVVYFTIKNLLSKAVKYFPSLKFNYIAEIYQNISINKDVSTIEYKFKNSDNNIIQLTLPNRKDSPPLQTVKRIKSILKKNNIKTKIKKIKSNFNKAYSVRLELLDGNGTNGKGTSLKLAKASAYGELIERLQSNMIYKNKTMTNIISKKHYIYDALLSKASDYYKKNFYLLNDSFFVLDNATNIKTNSKELIPINAISSFCHTNGIASGNTYEEAVNQAIFEILERHCFQECLLNKTNIPNINLYEYPLTYNNKSILDKFTKMNYKFYIKDCSLGKYPVIGFLLIDSITNKYTFTMASDFSFNIALSRCLTEMLQGTTIKKISKKMVTHENIDFLSLKYSKAFRTYNWLRCFNNNNGWLTENFFCEEYSTIQNLKFNDNLITNSEILKELTNNIDQPIYVYDYTNFNYNTHRVYIPNMTSVDTYDKIDIFINLNYFKLKNTYTNILNTSSKDILFFLKTFIKACKYVKYDSLILPIDLFHLNPISKYYTLDFTSLLIILCLNFSMEKELIELLKYKLTYHPLNDEKIKFYKILINNLTQSNYYDVHDDSILNFIINLKNDPKNYLYNLNPQPNTTSKNIFTKK